MTDKPGKLEAELSEIHNTEQPESVVSKFLPEVPEPPAEPEDAEASIPLETPEERQAKRKDIAVIKSYLLSQFGKHIREYEKMDFQAMSAEKVREILAEIEDHVTEIESISYFQNQFLSGCMIYENVMNKFGVRCNGLTGLVAKNDQLLKNVDLVVLKRRWKISPETAIVSSILAMTLMLHQNNKAQENAQEIKQKLDKPAAKKSKEEFKDLDK